MKYAISMVKGVWQAPIPRDEFMRAVDEQEALGMAICWLDGKPWADIEGTLWFLVELPV